MIQMAKNAEYIKSVSPDTKIAVMTNCNIPKNVTKYIDVISPIRADDVRNTPKKQWYPRMLYNAYLPFNISLIADTHVWPCDKFAFQEMLQKFEDANIDISWSNRENVPSMFGAGVLSRFSNISFNYWKEVYAVAKKRGWDDQKPQFLVINNDKGHKYRYRTLSSNWFFASHGIYENGVFYGDAKCYRSSVVVTGPVRIIHGALEHCGIINGPNNEFIHHERAYYCSGECNTAVKGCKCVLSENELSEVLYPVKVPKLDWNSNKSADSLFW